MGIVAVVYIFAHKFWNQNLAILYIDGIGVRALGSIYYDEIPNEKSLPGLLWKASARTFFAPPAADGVFGRFFVFKNNLHIFFGAMVILTFLLEFIFDRLLRCMKEENGG